MEPAVPTLTLVCGPMFAGKTTELIRRVECARAGGRRVLVAKPARDVRYAPDAVVTHAGSRELAVAVHDLRALLPAVDSMNRLIPGPAVRVVAAVRYERPFL